MRALVRGKLLAIFTTGCVALWLVGLMPVALAPTARWRWRSWIFRTWARGVLALLRVEVEVEGQEPRPPFILAANHLSYLDVVVLASRVDAIFVAKSEVAGWPILGVLCRCMGTLFVERGRPRDVGRVLQKIETALEAGRGVVLFPEGTSTAGITVAPFRSPLLEAAVRSGVGAHWAALGYGTPTGAPPAHLSVCWWGDMTFGTHLLGLLGLPGVTARVHFGKEPIREPDRKRLAARLHEAVLRRFEPVQEET